MMVIMLLLLLPLCNSLGVGFLEPRGDIQRLSARVCPCWQSLLLLLLLLLLLPIVQGLRHWLLGITERQTICRCWQSLSLLLPAVQQLRRWLPGITCRQTVSVCVCLQGFVADGNGCHYYYHSSKGLGVGCSRNHGETVSWLQLIRVYC